MARKVMGTKTPDGKPEPKKKSRFETIDIAPEASAVVEQTPEQPTPSEEPTEIVCVIDRSGSMMSIKNDAIGGFNSFLKEQKEEPGAATMTIILFDNQYEVLCSGKPINEVEPLNDNTFVPRGSTALNDAIGKAIGELKQRNPKNAIISVLTDGQENASHEYTKQQIKEMLKECSDKGYFVAYLSASIDAFADAQSVGIGQANAGYFTPNSEGIRYASLGASYATSAYRGSGGAHGMMLGRMSSMSNYMSRAKQDIQLSTVPSPYGGQRAYQPGTNDLNDLNAFSRQQNSYNQLGGSQPYQSISSSTPFTTGASFTPPKKKKHTNKNPSIYSSIR